MASVFHFPRLKQHDADKIVARDMSSSSSSSMHNCQSSHLALSSS